MKEIKGDIFAQFDADAICVTTNGVVKNNGQLVMGAGIAEKFAIKFPDIASNLGVLVKKHGNHVYVGSWKRVDNHPQAAVSFPTKHDWKQPSSLQLIEQSSRELVALTDTKGWTKVVLPRPGCGLGGLRWEQVRPVLASILDDRFYVITPEVKP